MEYQKKFYKSFKFWITTLLTISSTSIFASFILSSCTVNVNKNETISSDIVFNTPINTSQEISSNDTSELTLLVDVTSKQGKELKFQWYVDKQRNNNWEEILGATNNTYVIPANEIKNISEEVTWNYKADIYHSDNENVKLTTDIISVKIIPQTSTIPPSPEIPEPDTPTTPEPKPEIPTPPTTKPEEPILPPTKPEEPKPPLVEPDTPTTPEDPEEPDVSPDEYETVKARPNDYIINKRENTGITTVKYDQEKWICNNSVSISFVCQPNIGYIKKYLSEYISQNSNASSDDAKLAYKLAKGFSNALNDSYAYSIHRISNGTAWILDYSYDKNNSNLINYYLASNIHVLEATYTISYAAAYDIAPNKSTVASFSASIPINNESVRGLDVYISQPQYSESGAINNTKIPINKTNSYSNAWHKLPITINNLYDSLIDLGSFNANAQPELITPYAFQLSYAYDNDSNELIKDNFYYPKNKSSATKKASKSSKDIVDFGVLKISESKTSFDSFTQNNQWTTMFQKLQTMFKVDTDDKQVNKNSSYIARLNALLTMLKNNKYSKNKTDNLFMFADYKKDLTNTTTLSTAGFPLTVDRNGYSYSNFNSNTMSNSLKTKVTNKDKVWRDTIGYSNNGSLYYSNYDWGYDDLLDNVVLLGGSSGGMSVTQKYKISGIYWGTLTYEKESIQQGITSNLYSYSDDNSVIKLWLKYVKNNDKESKLLELFDGLEKVGYFNS